MCSLFLDFRHQAGVQATNYPLIFLISDNTRSYIILVQVVSARHNRSLYTDKWVYQTSSHTVQKAMLILN